MLTFDEVCRILISDRYAIEQFHKKESSTLPPMPYGFNGILHMDVDDPLYQDVRAFYRFAFQQYFRPAIPICGFTPSEAEVLRSENMCFTDEELDTLRQEPMRRFLNIPKSSWGIFARHLAIDILKKTHPHMAWDTKSLIIADQLFGHKKNDYPQIHPVRYQISKLYYYSISLFERTIVLFDTDLKKLMSEYKSNKQYIVYFRGNLIFALPSGAKILFYILEGPCCDKSTVSRRAFGIRVPYKDSKGIHLKFNAENVYLTGPCANKVDIQAEENKSISFIPHNHFLPGLLYQP